MPWDSLVLLFLLTSGVITVTGALVAELRGSESMGRRAAVRLELSTGSSYPVAARPAPGRHRANVSERQR
ncbi:hypothetical protein OHB26_38570 [Nocardia sp. NBC_01503]|uniref:hypothetical protein n=1 Tax=Nocardia sp. NBC_01503 TaxID=2975997 RepID=UPI002E7BFD4C|nr:hypothetical protein [Nocardia sp. NBC_01503]WTL32684.1 hypothetical protein OHB26_38570 [Nocardia sp. NBC_01503]